MGLDKRGLGILATLGVAVLVFAFWGLTRPPAALAVPARLADLPMRAQLVGPDAAQEIERLHARRIPMRAAAVALYGQGEVVLWVSDLWLTPAAQVVERRMVNRIRTGETPFFFHREREVQGVRVYEMFGMGQVHYLFHIGPRLYWLAVDPGQAEEALQDLLRFTAAAVRSQAKRLPIDDGPSSSRPPSGSGLEPFVKSPKTANP